MVFQVAKAELRNLFYSPVAWFLLIVFIIQCGWFYTTPLFNFANWQDVYLKNNPKLTASTTGSYTRALFLGEDGFLTNVLQNLYLFIPLLTMGLIGREVQNGTIKLLYSSPVKIRQIVMGKYLAIMFYNLMLVLVVFMFFLTAAANVKLVDFGMLLSAALGLFLLTCAYTAIGAFMSSLSTYQVVTALGTFVVILVLTMIGKLWQQYDFVRDLTYFLHLSGRTEKMLLGLITSKDVIYFLVVITMFLMFTMLRLRGARETKPWHIKAGRYIGVVGAALMVGYISSRPATTLYWDTTAQKVNTIHPKTQQIIKAMGDEPLEVTLYTNLLGRTEKAGLPENRNAYLTELWEKFTRFKPDIKFKYEYYYEYDSTVMGTTLAYNVKGKSVDFMARKKADHRDIDMSIFQKPAAMRERIDLRGEGYHLVMQLKYKGHTEYLRTYVDNVVWPYEDNVAAVLKRLLYPEKIPHVYFITGHYERHIYKRGEREYGAHTAIKATRTALVNKGFNVDTLSLDNSDIPGNTAILVLADPKSALSDVCLGKIRNYLDKGGNMFILGEPGKQSIVNPVLRQLGVQLSEGIIVRGNKHEAPELTKSYGTKAFVGLKLNPSSPVFRRAHGDASLSMHSATALERTDSSNFTYTTLFKAGYGSWLKRGVFVRDSGQVVFNEAEGDVRELPPVDFPVADKEAKANLFPTMIALQRNLGNKDQRIIIAGDADCLSNRNLFQVSLLSHYFYSWLSYGDFPVYILRPGPRDTLLIVSGKTAKALGIIYVYIIPAIILLVAAILLIRRKRK